MKTISLIMLVALSTSVNSIAQQKTDSTNLEKKQTMKTYLIEREIPNAGQLTQEQLKGISQKSCAVIKEMRLANIQWLHSYVADNKVYCLYKAKNKEHIKEHAKLGGFPANTITEVSTTISPETARN